MRAILAAATTTAGLLSGVAHAAPSQTATVKLLAAATATANPGGGRIVARIAATRPLTGSPTVLPIIGHATADGHPWVRVRIPARPNETTGWIRADAAQQQSTRWAVSVSRARRTATVLYRGRPIRTFRVVVGAPSTPTPAGAFFISEIVKQPAGTATGPYVLATSAYSDVLHQFGGGPGQIGLHGRTGLPDPLGSAASHGCVRFDDAAVRWMATRLRAGTPLTIS
jgi:lipoprotein-anchoring transpeptidase ErfK/SrfK